MPARPVHPDRSRGPTKVIPGPVYDLEREVLPVAKLAHVGAKRGWQQVADVLGCGQGQAESFIRDGLGSLTSGNYSESVELDFPNGPPIPADVYGIRYENRGWYVKFYVEHGRVQVVSFHTPIKELRCRDGTLIPKGG